MRDDYTKHQQGIIKRYYENHDQISLQKLGELVGDLYLAEGKKRQRVWASVVKALQGLKVPQVRIDLLVQKDDAAALAALMKELDAKQP